MSPTLKSESIARRRHHKPNPAKPYKAIATSNCARMPNTSDRFSSKPPATAPRIFAPRAALGESTILNSSANSIPAKNIGMAKIAVASAPAIAGDPGSLFTGSAYANASEMISAPRIAKRGIERLRAINDEVRKEQRDQQRRNYDSVYLPCRSKKQRQTADNLSFEQQKSGAHAEKEERRRLLSRLWNTGVQADCDQYYQNRQRIVRARNPMSFLIEIRPVIRCNREPVFLPKPRRVESQTPQV